MRGSSGSAGGGRRGESSVESGGAHESEQERVAKDKTHIILERSKDRNQEDREADCREEVR